MVAYPKNKSAVDGAGDASPPAAPQPRRPEVARKACAAYADGCGPMLVATATINAARAMLVTRTIIESRLQPVTIR